jgi:hypothetical protein
MKQAQIDKDGTFHCTLGVGEKCTVTWQSNDPNPWLVLTVICASIIVLALVIARTKWL